MFTMITSSTVMAPRVNPAILVSGDPLILTQAVHDTSPATTANYYTTGRKIFDTLAENNNLSSGNKNHDKFGAKETYFHNGKYDTPIPVTSTLTSPGGMDISFRPLRNQIFTASYDGNSVHFGARQKDISIDIFSPNNKDRFSIAGTIDLFAKSVQIYGRAENNIQIIATNQDPVIFARNDEIKIVDATNGELSVAGYIGERVHIASLKCYLEAGDCVKLTIDRNSGTVKIEPYCFACGDLPVDTDSNLYAVTSPLGYSPKHDPNFNGHNQFLLGTYSPLQHSHWSFSWSWRGFDTNWPGSKKVIPA